LPMKKRKVNYSEDLSCFSFGSSSQSHLNYYYQSFHQVAVDPKLSVIEAYKNSIISDIAALMNINGEFLPQQVRFKGCSSFPCNVIQQENLSTRLVEYENTHYMKHQEMNSFDKMWNKRYNELVTFWKKYGHSCVPQRYLPNKSLGKWVHKQRQEFKKKSNGKSSSLNSYRIASLKKVGFQFNRTNRAEGLWQHRYNELVSFRKTHGHCNVPQKYLPNKALGKWVHRQRHEYSKKLNDTENFLTKKRIEALDKINFQWIANRRGCNEQIHELLDMPLRKDYDIDKEALVKIHPKDFLGTTNRIQDGASSFLPIRSCFHVTAKSA